MARQKSTDLLSPEARSLMFACFAQGLTALQTRAKLLEKGEDVAERTIGRRKAEWEDERERRRRGRERMEDLLSAARSGDHTASEMVNALAIEQLMLDPDGALALDPIELQRTSIAAEKVRLDRERLQLKSREIALNEKRFELLQKQQERAIEETEALAKKAESGQALTAEDVRRIRDIYGLA